MLLWNLALHPVLCRVMDRHPEVVAICFADNVVLLGLAKDSLSQSMTSRLNRSQT